jgi:hypothetical protein
MATLVGCFPSPVLMGDQPNEMAFTLPLPPTASTGRYLAGIAAGSSVVTGDAHTTVHSVDRLGYMDPSIHQFWFERIHSFPTYLALGNILSTVLRDLEIYNAYREEDVRLLSVENTAGVGTSLLGLPTLPYDLPRQHSLLVQLQAVMEGPSTIDGSLVFDFTPDLVTVAVTGSRVVVFPYEPESPLSEVLEFKTLILTMVDGTEQRISIRKAPRQLLDMGFRLDEGDLQREAQALLLGWQDRVFGVPIWWEGRPLTAAATAGAYSITVDTAYGDFRVGAAAILWEDAQTYAAMEITEVAADALTFSSPLPSDFPAGVLVMPLRTAYANPTTQREFHLINVQDMRMQFITLDNDSGLESAAAFPTHNARVLLHEPNLVEGGFIPDTIEKAVERLDNGVSPLRQSSTWLSARAHSQKGFLGNSLQRIWEVRQLLHTLRGSQVAFYLPSFYADLELAGNLSSGGATLDVVNIGYTAFVNGAEPYKSIWIKLTNGTILTRQVLSSVVISDTVERLTVDVVWPSAVLAADVETVSFLRLSRVSDDKATFVHERPGVAQIMVNVVGVQK